MASRADLRLAIMDQDKTFVNDNFGVGDGNTVYFRTSLFPVRNGTQVLATETTVGVITALTLTTDYTITDATGEVIMVTAPALGVIVRAQKYEYNAFSDTELDSILALYGADLNLSAAHCCRILAVNAAKFFAYWAGDEKVDRTKESEHLRKMAMMFEGKAMAEQAGLIDIGIFRDEKYDPVSEDDDDIYGILQG